MRLCYIKVNLAPLPCGVTVIRETYFGSVRDFWFGGGDKRAAPGTGILTLAIEDDSAEVFSCHY